MRLRTWKTDKYWHSSCAVERESDEVRVYSHRQKHRSELSYACFVTETEEETRIGEEWQ